MIEYIDKAKLMAHIESESRLWGEEYDAEQILGDIEDFPAADVVDGETYRTVLEKMNEFADKLLKIREIVGGR